jgi:cobalt-zinc-cadmium efflux system protein
MPEHGGHAHGRGRAHGHDHGSVRGAQRRALVVSLGLNAVFLVAEVVGGLAFRSLALLADAAHMTSDVAGLTIALVAQRLLERPATARHSYGLQRAEVLGAQANAITLLAVAGWIVYEAIRRLGEPVEVLGGGLLVVATLGLAVNLGSAVLLARARGGSLNMHGAFVHMAVDAAGSVGAIAAGVAVVAWDANWADPAISIAIAALVLWSAWGLLRDTAHVLMAGAPAGIDPTEVEATVAGDDEVEAVHHLHLWNLASDVPALSAHVVVKGEVSLHDAQETGDRLKALLDERFGIEHASLELECHVCETPDGGHATSSDGRRRRS